MSEQLGMDVESYVLHVYRLQTPSAGQKARRVTDRLQVVGVLEMSVSEQRLPFHTIEELWELLNGAGRTTQSKHIEEN